VDENHLEVFLMVVWCMHVMSLHMRRVDGILQKIVGLETCLVELLEWICAGSGSSCFKLIDEI
jgi:hypothetical protein